ncbi:helix-turn-helix domain-containing protein [Planococcus sp. FY231025]|uniref:helix-turn-helix domain-containing protein n=1 Tax=Planococcus sp. FY231025 TaxID=3455699 RepID=UPI003F916A6E
MVYNKLKQIRIQRGMSIAELSRRTKISRTTITILENEKSNPTVKTIQAISKALESDPADIFFAGSVNHELHRGWGTPK